MCGINTRKKLRLIRENGPICEKCHSEFSSEDLTVHHPIPRAILRGLDCDITDNEMLLCVECHRAVHTRLCPGSQLWCHIAQRLPSLRSETKKSRFLQHIKDTTILMVV